MVFHALSVYRGSYGNSGQLKNCASKRLLVSPPASGANTNKGRGPIKKSIRETSRLRMLVGVSTRTLRQHQQGRGGEHSTALTNFGREGAQG